MDYSCDLAERSRMSPWQCIDCKTCYICEDSEDAVSEISPRGLQDSESWDVDHGLL